MRKGDLEAAFKQAEANLKRDLAQAKHAREDARRYESLIQKGVVPPQQYAKFRTDAEEASEISCFSSNIDLTPIYVALPQPTSPGWRSGGIRVMLSCLIRPLSFE